MAFTSCFGLDHEITKPFSALNSMICLQPLQVNQLCDTHQSLHQLPFYFIFLIFCMFIFERQRETEYEGGGRRQRETEYEAGFQALNCQHRA